MRHCAWLSAVPDKHESDKTEKSELSRRESLKNNGVEVVMPECEAEYLVSYLFEIGPTMAAGAGEGPITQSEMQSWQFNTGIDLDSWEARFLRRLSIDYLSESQRATKRDCVAPWEDAPYFVSPAKAASERMKNSIRALSNL